MFTMNAQEKKNIEALLSPLKNDARVQQMKQFIQHGSTTTYAHCEHVAALSYAINRRLKLHADEKTLLTGAMLHDFYLYDWHADDGGTHRLHGYHHADKALSNAIRYFDIGEKEQHIIYSHMWPLNLTHVPHSREAWIVCVADKCVSFKETLFSRKKRKEKGTI